MKYIINNTISINNTIEKMQDGDTIYLKNGIYKEKIETNKNNIIIEGESKENVIIVNNDYYHKIMSDYNECNTFRTYTFYIGGNNVTLKNITIKNSSVPSTKYGQAIALYVDGTNFNCNNVILDGAQDTLFTGPLPIDLIERYERFLNKHQLKKESSIQVYKNCKIIGDVDFIFGCATAVFQECEIHSLNNKYGYCTAPAHSINTEFGYLFYRCNFTCDEGTQNVFLARPWREYGAACFIDCTYLTHIRPEGFNKWEGTNRDKTARFIEYNENYDLSRRARFSHILNEEEKNNYLKNFFNHLKIQ